ncbi:helix-turn-helix domain-containing protein [Chromobacterium phragmitis]|uniref:helix-turn-helix domain-containing protein n=1 Tax=Chromobacterium phragmitis TaxID=2202141 RepID=UPI003D36E06D
MERNTKLEIGLRIKEARLLRRKSQAWVAEQIEVTQPSVSEWERGDSSPSTSSIAKLCQALQVNFKYILTGEGSLEGNSDVTANPVSWEPEPLPDDEAEMLELYRSMTRSRREAVLQFLRTFVTK